MSTDKKPLPLDGVRILDLATFVAAPFAASVLSEFGAEVIKVEQPGTGDSLRKFGTPTERGDGLMWLTEARNKRSITLNLREPEGVELLKRLAKDADVVCENFRPGTMEKWGLGWDVLHAVNPKLVMLRVSGYGQTGPYKDRPAFARIAHAYGALSYLTGMPGEAPLTPGSTSLADYISGLYGAIGILLALRSRDATGEGQMIDVALFESIFRVLDEIATAFAWSGTVRPRLGLHTSNACPHGHFETQDGEWVSIACTTDKMFARFAAVMEQPELAGADRFASYLTRIEQADEVNALVGKWFANLTREDALNRCLAGDVPIAPVNSIADVFKDPHYKARETIIGVHEPTLDKEIMVPNVLPRLSNTPGRIASLGPTLGNANDDVYGEELGLTADEISALQDKGVI
ncbi:MAG: CoA transferase [Alphaproteobacteria bacterium]|nr:CoA transferase [Alphaproteobacteria bacterium]